MLLLVTPLAFAVPKAFSDDVAVLAVSPAADAVLVGTVHSFVDAPDRLRVRTERSGYTPVPAEADLLACVRTQTCSGGGAWYVEPATWLPSPFGATSAFFAWKDGEWAAGCAQGLACEMTRDGVGLKVARDADDLVFTETRGTRSRVVRLRAARLRRLGAAPETASVYWGTAGVLVAVSPRVERVAEELLFVWVLGSR